MNNPVMPQGVEHATQDLYATMLQKIDAQAIKKHMTPAQKQDYVRHELVAILHNLVKAGRSFENATPAQMTELAGLLATYQD